MPHSDLIDRYVSALPGETRRLGPGQWGITVEPESPSALDIGLRISNELLKVQAFVASQHPMLDPWLFLAWNRQTRLIRFGATKSGDIWINADVPLVGLDEQTLDRVLGLVVEGAVTGRNYAAAAMAAMPSAN